jgi:diguanylate cyclase (GGDEF)-like protein
VVGLVFYGLFLAYQPPRGADIATSSVIVTREHDSFGRYSVPWYTAATDRAFVPGTYRFSVEIPSDQSFDAPLLVVPFFAGNSLTVAFNGTTVGRYGDPVSGESSIWNSAFLIPLSAGEIEKNNQVDIDVYGRYDAGLLRAPYIADGGAARGRLFLLSWYSTYAVMVLVGAAAIIAFVLIGGSFSSPSAGNARLLIGLGSLATACILLDFARLESLPIPLLAFKQIVIAARHAAAALFVAGAMGFLQRRRDPVGVAFLVVQIGCILAIAFVPGSIVQLKRVYSVTFILFVPFLVYIAILTVLGLRERPEYGILLFGILVASVTSAFDIVSMTTHPDRPFTSHFGIVVLTLAAGTFVIIDMLGHYRLLVAERRRSHVFLQASIRDQLTGAYNRRVFPLVARELDSPYSVIVLDLDDFKRINDTYGHVAGDETLRRTASVMQNKLRSDDFVVRTGGDEFLAILPNCPAEQAMVLARRILDELSGAAPPQPGRIAISASIGVATVTPVVVPDLEHLELAIGHADAATYRAKRDGKGHIVAAQPIAPLQR